MPRRKSTEEGISVKQQEILDYLKSQIQEKGYPPSVREICDAVHLKSTSSVHAHLNTLEMNGYIRRDPTKPRAIEITDGSFKNVVSESVAIPVVGRVAAGEPILAEQNIEDYFTMPAEYVPSTQNDIFGLTVHGDSMINVGIFNKDILIVESMKSARNGDIVVALIDDSATVKTFYKEDGRYRLQPENDTMDPIYTDHVEILGKVRSLFRPAVF